MLRALGEGHLRERILLKLVRWVLHVEVGVREVRVQRELAVDALFEQHGGLAGTLGPGVSLEADRQLSLTVEVDARPMKPELPPRHGVRHLHGHAHAVLDRHLLINLDVGLAVAGLVFVVGLQGGYEGVHRVVGKRVTAVVEQARRLQIDVLGADESGPHADRVHERLAAILSVDE